MLLGRKYKGAKPMIKSAEWVEILRLRSVKEKLAVAIEGRPQRIKTALLQMRRLRYIVWLDSDTIDIHGKGIKCDIYLLTVKGSRLCDEHGFLKH